MTETIWVQSAEYQKQSRYRRGESGGLLDQKLETDLEIGEQKCHGRKRIECRLQDITRRFQCCGLLHRLTGRCCKCCFPFQIIKDEARRYIFEQSPESRNGKMPPKTSPLDHCFWKEHEHVLCFILKWHYPECLSKEACLYAGTQWLKLICQSEAGEKSNGSYVYCCLLKKSVVAML